MIIGGKMGFVIINGVFFFGYCFERDCVGGGELFCGGVFFFFLDGWVFMEVFVVVVVYKVGVVFEFFVLLIFLVLRCMIIMCLIGIIILMFLLLFLFLDLGDVIVVLLFLVGFGGVKVLVDSLMFLV